MAPPQRTLFIVNPRSAGGRTAREWPAIEKLASQKLGEVTTWHTEATGHATELARRGLDEGFDLIVSVGGDGTNNEVLNGFFDGRGRPRNPATAFGILPRGTGSDLAKTLDVSPKDPQNAIGRLRREPRPLDAGRVELTDHEGATCTRYFINVSGFGANGDVVDRVNHSSKRFGGFLTFAAATVASLLSYDNRRVAWKLDDEPEREERINSVFVCNARYAGGGMIVGPRARMDDGLLDFTVIGDITRAGALASGRYLYSGRIGDHPQVRCLRGRRLRARPLEDRPVLIDADGEQPGRLPATFEVLPGILPVRA